MIADAVADPEDRAEVFFGGYLDDLLWTQAIRTNHFMDLDKKNMAFWGDGSALWGLLKRGLNDQREADCPWDASTRSMRYTAIVANRLWTMVNEERARVSPTFLSPTLSVTDSSSCRLIASNSS
jgi:hypothetical protein